MLVVRGIWSETASSSPPYTPWPRGRGLVTLSGFNRFGIKCLGKLYALLLAQDRYRGLGIANLLAWKFDPNPGWRPDPTADLIPPGPQPSKLTLGTTV